MSNTRKLASATVCAITDQGTTSAASFVANAVLIRFASKDSYGVYVVAFSTLLLIASTVDVLFSLQMTYLAPHHPEAEQPRFCAALRTAQTYTSTALGVVICLASWIGNVVGLLTPIHMVMGMVVGVGSLLISWQEYYKSIFYLFDMAGYALLLGAVQIGVWLGVTAGGVVLRTKLPLSATVLAGYCIGAGVAAGIGLFVAPLPKAPPFVEVRRAAAEAWEQGSWSLFGSVISWVQNQSFAWLLAILATAAAAAEANFAKLFFAPLGLMLQAVNRVARPGLGKVFARSGEQAAVRQGRKLLMAMVALVAAYCPIILVGKTWLIARAGASAYRDAGVLIIAWGVVTAFQVTRWNSTLLLGVLRRNRQMTTVQGISAACALAASIASIPLFGAMGAILSVGFAEALLTCLMWREVNRALGSEAQPSSAVIPQPLTDAIDAGASAG